MKIDLCFSIPGADLYAEITFHVTYRGYRGDRDSPPEAPDFGVDFVQVFEDDAKSINREVPLPSWLLAAIAESDEAAEKMAEFFSAYGEDY